MATETMTEPPHSEQQIHTLLDEEQDINNVSSPNSLRVITSWKTFKAWIHPNDRYYAGKNSTPIYTVDLKCFKPHLIFRDGSSNDEEGIFATGTLNYVSINALCQVRGRDVKIQALKRWRTKYEHLSYAFGDNEIVDGKQTPVPMTWTANCGLKNWTFVCSDQHGNPVARFRAANWSFSQVGVFEFLGERSEQREAREEIVVTGLTLFYCMLLRSHSLLSFAGAIFARPGHQKIA